MKYIGKIVTAALLLLAVTSCTEDMKYKPGKTTSVEQLIAPANNYYVELQSSASEILSFSWSPAMAEDGMKPHYEIAFSKTPGGEVVKYHDAGMNPATTVSHKDLNKIAGLLGIKTGSTGDVYWTVVASRAGERAPVEATANCLTIKRLNGFEEIPPRLYLLGDGTDADNAALRCLESGADGGEFSVYAKLEAGKEYYFVSTVDEGATARTFAIGANNIIDETPQPAVVAESGIYRLYLDFNTRAAILTRIDKIQMFQCSQNKMFQDFTYEGRGVWTATNMVTETGDDRYLFRTWTNGAANWNEKWASKNWDNSSAPSAGSAADFWSVHIQTDRLNDDWGYSYKWIHAEWDTKLTVDVRIVMNLDDYDNKAFFYHEVSYK
ncbi:SusE domain-containing protein [uncultured Alistipes sp.]|jgi:hypothetical protein|uniref:SusE domain-containing protein n=1 Tax=uncultured Alistipes sp. TaxID=538949 RepID=UPI0025E67B3E|nr:SusE domain-containing protein [uncultured Alistipes sp.]